MSSYIFILKKGVTCWKGSMQYLVVSFICNIEFFAVFDAGKKVIWLWKFISDLGVAPFIDDPVFLY